MYYEGIVHEFFRKAIIKLRLGGFARQLYNKFHIHRDSDLTNIFIFSTPRSGSTLLMDIAAIS